MISFQDLSKVYKMGLTEVRALNGVSAEIKAGDFVSLIGPSGSGKSTMMHLLGCLERPSGGRYVLEGRVVSDMSDRELARIRNSQIGFVFQTFNLISRMSALENVAVPMFYARKSRRRKPAMKALERVGLTPRAKHAPSELSGGERQRVAIARALVNDPKLLFADEPTGNLDSKTGEQIMEIFHELHRQGVTVVLVTHEPTIAAQAERMIRLLDGKIIEDRTVEESERTVAV